MRKAVLTCFPVLLLSWLVVAGPATVRGRPASFREVRDRVFARPQAEFPSYHLFPPVAAQVALGLAKMGGELASRLRRTTTEADNFKEARPKIIHALGVCAEAEWHITESSPYTGLFARGSRVKALVRFSIGNNEAGYRRGETRIFGFAVKAFPTQDENERVQTANLFTMDQFGLDGAERRYFFSDDLRYTIPYFSNVATGTGFAAELALRLFGRFDRSPTIRPLYPFSEVTADHQRVAEPRTPEVIHFVSRAERPVRGSDDGADFRADLMRYEPGELRFDISVDDKKSRFEFRPLGMLTINRWVVSKACDQELHFHHHPTR